MWLWNRLVLVICVLGGSWASCIAQGCTLSITGLVYDLGTNGPIADATVRISTGAKGTATDSLGRFSFVGLCPGEVHLTFSHLGCETQTFLLHLSADTPLLVYLDHHSQLLQQVVIQGNASHAGTQKTNTITTETISDNAGQNLAGMLSTIAGVSALKNGDGISKPIIDGLYGSRITVLSSGVPLAGQQWGNDHAPEIDPLSAGYITVVKGVAALEYMGSSLGGVVLVEPQRLGTDAHLHGKAGLSLSTNGRGAVASLQLKQAAPIFSWRVTGSMKRSGDRRAPDYFLRNTGSAEDNATLQLERKVLKKADTRLFFSTFNTELGILRGSHIGNVTDLEESFTRPIPLYTSDTFSYRLVAPRQQVGHHMLKLQADMPAWGGLAHLAYAAQLNNRKEFDIRRGGRSTAPALSLQQWSSFAEGRWSRKLSAGLALRTGLQYTFASNTNQPGTGILPLIPDYLEQKGGVFLLTTAERGKKTIEFGSRYDFTAQQVAAISRGVPREVVRYTNQWGIFSASAGGSLRGQGHRRLALNLGLAGRNPGINELYSNGLHQGVSGIEEGDPTLRTEHSLKAALSFEGEWKKNIHLDFLTYAQQISNFIYLQPTAELRQTIRGSFPVFRYAQTDALLLGADAGISASLPRNWEAIAKGSLLRGTDQTSSIPLIGMAPANLTLTLSRGLPELGRFQKMEFEVNAHFSARQGRLLPAQDFVPPPDGYALLGLRWSADLPGLHNSQWHFSFRADNLLNSRYRDYLNRLRYFSDETGRAIIFGVLRSF